MSRILRHLTVLGITLAAVAAFPPVIQTVRQLHGGDWETVSRMSDYQWDDLTRPRSGEYVLPPHVQVMLNFLRSVNASTFRMSPAIAGHGPTMQRLVEGAFPIREAEDAPFYLMAEGEPLPAGCRLIMKEGEVGLARCP